MPYSDAELLSLHSEVLPAPAATGMFATLYDYAKLGSIFLNVSCPLGPMQLQLCVCMLSCHLVLTCRDAADEAVCLGCSLCIGADPSASGLQRSNSCGKGILPQGWVTESATDNRLCSQ